MDFVIAGALSLVFLALVVGALTGRIKGRPCCAVSEPERDLRMREAFLPPETEARTTPPSPRNVRD